MGSQKTERELGPEGCSEVQMNGCGHQVSRGWDLALPQGRVSKVFRWPGQGHTFTVHAVAPRSSWHGHLVLVAAGLTALPLSPGGHAAARVQVTVAPLALAALGRRGGERQGE